MKRRLHVKRELIYQGSNCPWEVCTLQRYYSSMYLIIILLFRGMYTQDGWTGRMKPICRAGLLTNFCPDFARQMLN